VEKKNKTPVLTLGSAIWNIQRPVLPYTANPPEKGRKKNKKTLVLTLGSPSKKGRKKKEKRKTLVLTLGSPLEKGGEKKRSCPSVRRGPETQNRDLDRWTDGQTTQLI
jgi:hypothetical protein